MLVSRTERHIIKSSDSYFSLLLSFCCQSKNLYNHANYLVRQALTQNNKLMEYKNLDKILKADKEYPDYRNMPTAQSAQQILRLLHKNWKTFMVSIKDWSKHKEKYSGRPKLPNYLKKNGYYVLILTNQNCKLKDGKIHFPKVFQGFSITPKFTDKENFVSFQQVRLIPHKNRIVAEVVYNIDVPELKEDNQRYIGIDIGVNNLATVCNSIGNKAFMINGKPLKSINQYYNKKISHCVKDDIHTIVIGKNKEWKQNSRLSKK